RINASAPRGINRAEYYIDGNLIATNNSFPFNLEKDIGFLKNGFHNLKVRVCDDIDNCSEQSFEFNLILDGENRVSNDINISWLKPANGDSINRVNFPVNIEIKTSNPIQTARIDVFLQSEKSEPALIASLGPIENEIASGNWKAVPTPGAYKLYGEAHSWSGQIKKSEEITVMIGN
ncbi:MAG: hypothetical protein PHQ42_03020, partial [Patescibacteria group bacterium]|nr:hypothetical protein [Patescibacteria group bacterium]